jgi:hypothetical protein
MRHTTSLPASLRTSSAKTAKMELRSRNRSGDVVDLWHYFGRTAKHGAYMGGADFSQWHGNYELQRTLAELRHSADELRRGRSKGGAGRPP